MASNGTAKRVVGPLLAAACSLIPLAAQAAEVMTPEVPVDFTPRWSGLYAGGRAGPQWTSWDVSGAAAMTPSASMTAGANSVSAGYNWQDRRWVYGFEGDLRSATGLNPLSDGASGSDQTKSPWFGTVRARGGFAADEWLIYGTGGLAAGRAPFAANTAALASAPGASLATALPALNQGKTQFGWTVGGGVEKAFGQNLSAKLEYSYVDLAAQNLAPATGDPKLRDHMVRFGLNYNFNFDLRPFYRHD
jgi:outer membrane immunogenic protein